MRERLIIQGVVLAGGVHVAVVGIVRVVVDKDAVFSPEAGVLRRQPGARREDVAAARGPDVVAT